jgi:hypothetical protein
MGMHINNDDIVALWCLLCLKCSWYINQVYLARNKGCVISLYRNLHLEERSTKRKRLCKGSLDTWNALYARLVQGESHNYVSIVVV